VIYRSLGKTGLRVSSLGFGGSSLGGAFGPVDEGEAIRAVHAAIDAGINIFDTAPYYGATRAESVLGKALAQTPRDRVVLSTKVGRYGERLEDFDFSAERVTRSVDESLRRLGVDYIDIIQVHDIEFGDIRQILEETIPALKRMQSSGRVRYIGVSGFPLPLLLEVALESGVEVVQSYCHASLINTELTCIIPKLAEIGAGILSSAPLAMRLLTDVGPPDWHPASREIRARCAEAAGYCRDRGGSISDLALYYSYHISGPHCTLLGISNCNELTRALAAIQTPPAAGLLENVLRILEPVRNASWVSGRPENQP
jgi:L-galactose dehydrogenase